MRFNVRFRLAETIRQRVQAESPEAVGAEIGLNPPYVAKLGNGTWVDMTREQMQRLAIWAREHGHSSELFDFGAIDPVWETFSGAPARLILGSGTNDAVHTDDNTAATKIFQFLAHDGGAPRQDAFRHPSSEAARLALADQVRSSAMNENGVLICGPRRNAAVEVMSSLLFDAVPFDTSEGNRRKIPYHLTYFNEAPEVLDSSFASISQNPAERGVRIHDISLPFPFQPDSQWQKKSTKPIFDFAVVVICRKPFGTKKPVTTLMVMGLTGFATLSACESLAAEELQVDSLQDGVPEVRIYCAKFKKAKGKDNRRPTDGCRWVGQPWDFPAAAVAATPE